LNVEVFYKEYKGVRKRKTVRRKIGRVMKWVDCGDGGDDYGETLIMIRMMMMMIVMTVMITMSEKIVSVVK